MPTLFGLPHELVLRVLEHLEPVDLLKLSEVCKISSTTLADRWIWEHAVRNIYLENSLFEPSFLPLNSMDLDGLKKAALRPRFFQHVFEANAASRYDRRPSERLLKCSVDEGGRNDFIRVQMVPGGRYVIGLASTYICLWDVGSPGATQNEAILLDTVHGPLGHSNFQTMSVPSQFTNDSFRFATHSHDGQESDQRVQVYQVGSLPNDPRIQQVSELCLDGDASMSRFWISGSRVHIYRYNNLFVVWDFTKAGIVSWRLSGVRRPCEIYNVEDVVLLLRTNTLLAWKLPALRPMEPDFTLPTVSSEVLNPPICQLQYQDSVSTVPRNSPRWMAPSKWLNHNLGIPTVIDALTHTQKGTFQLRRLRINVSGIEPHVQVEVLSALESYKLGTLYKGPHRPYTSCGTGIYAIGSVQYLTTLNTEISIHRSTLRTESPESWQIARLSILHLVDTVSLICPYSGRFAYVCQHGHHDEYNRIHVVDLFDR